MNSVVQYQRTSESAGECDLLIAFSVGASGAPTVIEKSPSFTTITRTGAGLYTIASDGRFPGGLATWGAVRSFTGQVIGANGVAGTDGQIVRLKAIAMTDTASTAASFSIEIQKTSGGVVDVASGDQVMVCITLKTSTP
jgi:hypothetical protein